MQTFKKIYLILVHFHEACMQLGFYSMLAELIWPQGSPVLLLTPRKLGLHNNE